MITYTYTLDRYDFFEEALHNIGVGDTIWYTQEYKIPNTIIKHLKKYDIKKLIEKREYFNPSKHTPSIVDEFTIVHCNGKESKVWISCPDTPGNHNVASQLYKLLSAHCCIGNPAIPIPPITEVHFRK
uniref:Uncharacterized protein n=1 Tax=Prevotella sp. GTC17253 TaxID=3236793 RepID=A0AB33IMF6_9BACT